MSTAAERAAEVIADVRFAWQRGDIADTVSRSEQAAQVAALMRLPDLLVDLAIEAGGLEHHHDHIDEGGMTYCPPDERTGRVFLDLRYRDPATFPLYRRAARPTGEDRA